MFKKIGDWARGLTQEQRNAFYKVAAALGALGVAFGLLTETDLDAIITAGGSLVTLVSTLLAIPNSGKKVDVVVNEPVSPVETGFIGDDYKY